MTSSQIRAFPVWQSLIFLLSILFGLSMIANIHPLGDGMWFWYARYLHHGQRLYADLHLALQPLFVLQTSWAQSLFGIGWLASKIPAVAELIAFCLGLLLLNRFSAWKDWQKAIVLTCAFIESVSFLAYRFDDYHVLADCFTVFSIYLLLLLTKKTSPQRSLVYVATLGVLSGLALATRLNDGGALLVAVGFILCFLMPSGRVLSLLLFAATAALTLIVIVKLTGDSLSTYASYSIFKAAASKGGTSNVLQYPLQLPVSTVKTLSQNWRYLLLIVYAIYISTLVGLTVRYARNPDGSIARYRVALGIAAILITVPPFRHQYLLAGPQVALSGFVVLVSVTLCIFVAVRFVRAQMASNAQHWNVLELLLLVPLGQLLSGSMSSAGSFVGLYTPVALFLLLFPIVFPEALRKNWQIMAYLVPVFWIAAAGFAYKVATPYAWHTYIEKPVFVNRQWYRHPLYGPMVIDRQQLQFIQSICDHVGSDAEASTSLLSLPFPYPNYFCGIRPWHGYIQTFFDTSSKQTIDTLRGELQTSPPRWIVYQRQMVVLKTHEDLYNSGYPLPHRALDELIMQKVARGEWKAVEKQQFGPLATWYLIQTGA